MKIVDEFTGRILEGRRWSEGLHQAVEAKEGVKIKEENQTLATITLQNYFRLYEKLAGMTGTAETEAAEFASTYDLQVVPIPTHRPLVRADQADLIYKTEEAKFDAVVDDLAERYETGQPVLVGTVSVEKSELLSRLLDKRGIPHEVLNAKQHTREAEIVAQAGRLGAVTVATNMAGRGVDILLGGNPEGLARQRRAAPRASTPTPTRARPATPSSLAEVRGRVQGRGRQGPRARRALRARHRAPREPPHRQPAAGPLRPPGRPGESRFYLSLEDDLMRLFATGAMSWVMGKALPDDVPIEAKMVTKAIERAQNTVEQRNAEIRKNVLKYDEVMNEQRKVIYAPPRPDPRRRRPPRRGARVPRRGRRRHRRHATASPTSPRSGTSRACSPRSGTTGPTELTVERARRGRAAPTSSYERLDGRGHRRYYERREAELGADDHARGRAPGDAADHRPAAGASTSTRWTTCRRASTCGPWARRTRSSSGSARASTCSAR